MIVCIRKLHAAAHTVAKRSFRSATDNCRALPRATASLRRRENFRTAERPNGPDRKLRCLLTFPKIQPKSSRSLDNAD